jgi:hypothetical protein
MKDQFGIEILPNRFFGIGKYKHCDYVCLKRKFDLRLYSVYGGDPECFDSDEVYFEVAIIKMSNSIITGLPFEYYPGDKLLGEELWRFDNYDEAFEFYTSKMLCESIDELKAKER